VREPVVSSIITGWRTTTCRNTRCDASSRDDGAAFDKTMHGLGRRCPSPAPSSSLSGSIEQRSFFYFDQCNEHFSSSIIHHHLSVQIQARWALSGLVRSSIRIEEGECDSSHREASPPDRPGRTRGCELSASAQQEAGAALMGRSAGDGRRKGRFGAAPAGGR